mmetsp:Transcript_147569/g.358181  ORF Transcript_147569/g.358181 Transcript_147569/m.358181 type:complete len:417 (-) Transcript_147569:362-1612(-)
MRRRRRTRASSSISAGNRKARLGCLGDVFSASDAESTTGAAGAGTTGIIGKSPSATSAIDTGCAASAPVFGCFAARKSGGQCPRGGVGSGIGSGTAASTSGAGCWAVRMPGGRCSRCFATTGATGSGNAFDANAAECWIRLELGRLCSSSRSARSTAIAVGFSGCATSPASGPASDAGGGGTALRSSESKWPPVPAAASPAEGTLGSRQPSPTTRSDHVRLRTAGSGVAAGGRGSAAGTRTSAWVGLPGASVLHCSCDQALSSCSSGGVPMLGGARMPPGGSTPSMASASAGLPGASVSDCLCEQARSSCLSGGDPAPGVTQVPAGASAPGRASTATGPCAASPSASHSSTLERGASPAQGVPAMARVLASGGSSATSCALAKWSVAESLAVARASVALTGLSAWEPTCVLPRADT